MTILQLSPTVNSTTEFSNESLDLMRKQAPHAFATAVLSAPREDEGAALSNTLSGLLNSGVQDIQLTYGHFEESGRLPAHLSAVLENLQAGQQNKRRVHVHIMGRELWLWKKGGRCGRVPDARSNA